MPYPVEIRRLGSRWDVIRTKVASFFEKIPDEGVTRAVFDEECLQGTDFYARDVIVESLRKAKLIFVARQGDDWLVFGRANNKRLADPDADSKLNYFLSGVSAPMFRLAKLAAGGDDVPEEVRGRRKVAVSDVVGFVTRYVDRGGTLPQARGALWDTFRPEALNIVARYERGLAQGATLANIAPPPAKPVRIAQGQDPQTRILAVLLRAGKQGITKSAIHKGFAHPRPSQAQVDEWLDEIVEAQCAYVANCKLGNMGRLGKRYFHYDMGQPHVVGGVLHIDDD